MYRRQTLEAKVNRFDTVELNQLHIDRHKHAYG